MIEIKNRHSGKIIYSSNKSTIKEAVVEAVDNDVNLQGADLRGANLQGTNLIGANLRDADLACANLKDTNLIGINLRGTDLKDTNLIGINLRGTDLIGTNLIGANLRDANLIGADLRSADLRGTDLIGADLIQINLPYYQAIVQKTHTRIGCKYFSNKEWLNFTDEEIDAMDENALTFWNSYKQIIFSAIESL